MLVPKKLSIKKLAIYISIIALMLGGTGFMLYQNQKLTNKKPVIAGDPAKYNELMKAGAVTPGGETAVNQPSVSSPAVEATTTAANQPSVVNKIKSSQAFDLTIFSSEKFKALTESVLIPRENSGLGKKDPFKPN